MIRAADMYDWGRDGAVKTRTRPVKVVFDTLRSLSDTYRFPAASKAIPSGTANWLVTSWLLTLVGSRFFCALTKSTWPISISAVSPPPPLAMAAAGNRSTRRLPGSVIHKFPALSKAILATKTWQTRPW